MSWIKTHAIGLLLGALLLALGGASVWLGAKKGPSGPTAEAAAVIQTGAKTTIEQDQAFGPTVTVGSLKFRIVRPDADAPSSWNGVRMSTDGGTTWLDWFEAAPERTVVGVFSELGRIYVDVTDEANALTRWSTSDGGASWDLAGCFDFDPTAYYHPNTDALEYLTPYALESSEMCLELRS